MQVHNSSASEPAVSVRWAITETFKKVAEEQNKVLAPLSDDLTLMESGLDSLCIAIIVARLDDELGLDPFSTVDDIVLPITVGDFIRIYENASE